MIISKRRCLTLMLAAAAMAGVAGAAEAQQGDKIRIGMTVSSTGSFALASQSGVRGVEVWVDEVNARGGIDIKGKKHKVELVKLDDRSDRQMVTRVYETLITDEKVDMLFAPFGSTLTGAAATVTERLNKFLVIWSAASDAIYQQGFKNIVSATQMPVSAMPRASMDLAAKLGAKKVAVVYSDEPFPAGLADGAKALADKHGMQTVMFEKYPKGQKDFSTMLQKAKALGVEVFYPTSYEGDLISMVRQMKQLDISFPFTFMVYASTPQFQEIGKEGEFVFSHTNYHPSVNWKVNAGLSREDFEKAYQRLFPGAAYAPDFRRAEEGGDGPVGQGHGDGGALRNRRDRQAAPDAVPRRADPARQGHGRGMAGERGEREACVSDPRLEGPQIGRTTAREQ
jgi:branched-chain amino acid transport system substrate-binding protein